MIEKPAERKAKILAPPIFVGHCPLPNVFSPDNVRTGERGVRLAGLPGINR